jgi:CDP-glucose 4,6-dehydratase
MISLVGQRILITGHTGFKGQWLAQLLHEFGAEVFGLDIEIALERFFVNPSIFSRSEQIDIRNLDQLKKYILDVKPNLIFHFAAQSIVSEAFENPLDTWSTNVLGTINLLKSIENANFCTDLVIASTDKVYANPEASTGNFEENALMGQEHYSGSKVAMESAVAFEVLNKESKLRVSIVRSGNVIGGGDFHLTRLLPGAANAISKGESLQIRNFSGVRPWLHVLDSLWGYLLISQNQYPQVKFLSVWNVGPELAEHLTTNQILDEIKMLFPEFSHNSQDASKYHETEVLRLNSSKIRELLGWEPAFTTSESVGKTLTWYLNSEDQWIRTKNQVLEYINKLESVKAK